jgi:hypothetical protein
MMAITTSNSISVNPTRWVLEEREDIIRRLPRKRETEKNQRRLKLDAAGRSLHQPREATRQRRKFKLGRKVARKATRFPVKRSKSDFQHFNKSESVMQEEKEQKIPNFGNGVTATSWDQLAILESMQGKSQWVSRLNPRDQTFQTAIRMPVTGFGFELPETG